MSSVLYRLARWVTRNPRRVLAGWVVLLVVLGAGAGVFERGTDDTFHLPGVESTDALEHLKNVFPELSGSGVVLAVETPPGRRVDEAGFRARVSAAAAQLGRTPHVVWTSDPFAAGAREQVSDDGRLAVVQAFLDVDALNVTPQTKSSLEDLRAALQRQLPAGASAHLGGDALSVSLPTVSPVELLGLGAALVVLLLLFRSVLAAAIPVLTAVFGAVVTVAALYFATAFTQIMSTAPVLALMLGLAVGIDYALFVLARHRDQLDQDAQLTIEESVARAVATAGSAVAVAGVTVVIALVGLFVARMPFLTTTGLAAGLGVTVAVAVSLTALPAIMTLAGERLRPRDGRRDARGRGRRAARPVGQSTFADRWIRGVTGRPLLVTLVVGTVLALGAIPAADLRLGIPDASGLEPGAPPRVTQELLVEHFGPGYPSPLLLTVDLLPTTDPVGVIRRIAADVARIPGVAAVPVSTPNRGGDTGIVQIVPTTAADDPATADLVKRLRALRPELRERYGVTTAVTGLTAITIDVSARLLPALLPFSLFVFTLSVLLLAVAFRSLAVPLTAVVGYLLSTGVAFAATALVWTHGVLAGPLRVQHVGSVLAFQPILVMGVLFGLAMDYQMFLVSRMREHLLRHGNPREAVVHGFAASERVVSAAAAIMLAIFAFFVPDGTADTKPIALALAVGVFVDAVVVRMTLVPAVLALLGHWAWWLPARVVVRLPVVDLEGEDLERRLRLQAQARHTVVLARDLTVRDDRGRAVVDRVGLTLAAGDAAVVTGPGARGLLLVLAGRVASVEGDLVVCGEVLPGRRAAVRRSVVVVQPGDPGTTVGRIAAAVEQGAPLLLVDPGDDDDAVPLLAAAHLATGRRTGGLVVACGTPAQVSRWQAALPHAQLVDTTPPAPVDPVGRVALAVALEAS